MRFNDTLNIDFITNNISEDLKIAPMLLIPFIENSFKHGVIKSRQLNIKINLQCEGKTIHFSIENTNTKTEMISKGIGLENIKKRLELLYNNKYALKIENKNDFFKVNLQLNLN